MLVIGRPLYPPSHTHLPTPLPPICNPITRIPLLNSPQKTGTLSPEGPEGVGGKRVEQQKEQDSQRNLFLYILHSCEI